MADFSKQYTKIPLSYIPDQWFITLGKYIDFEKVLVRRPLSDFILRQIPNISWEAIAKAQGISPLLLNMKLKTTTGNYMPTEPSWTGNILWIIL